MCPLTSPASSLPDGPDASPNSATATMGNSSPFEACTVMMRTKSPPAVDRAPGASFDSSSIVWNTLATRAGPEADACSISRTMRMALYTLAARARPSGPSFCNRVSKPESTTARMMARETCDRLEPATKSPMTRTARTSRGDHAASGPSSCKVRTADSNPWAKSPRRKRPSPPTYVDSSSKSPAVRPNMSLISTL